MDTILTLAAFVLAGIVGLFARSRRQSSKPTDQYTPNPDTGTPEPKPDEDYPEPNQPPPVDLPEPEPTPEPTPEPVPDPIPEPVAEPTPPPASVPAPKPAAPRVYTAAQQDAFLKAIGLPYGSAAKRSASTGKFQRACTWTNLTRDNDFGQLTTAAAETCVKNSHRISKYFHLYELRCKGQDAAQGSGKHCSSCRIIEADRELIRRLDIVREKVYKGPLSITVGYRCPGYNAYVGGTKNSAHMDGLASDIARKFSWRLFLGMGWHGIGKSRVDKSSVVHVDLQRGLPIDTVFQE